METDRPVTLSDTDYESRLFLSVFSEKPPGKMLELGAHDAPLATLFATHGFDVTSFDLRPYDGPAHPNHRHLTGDFVKLWPSLGMAGAFDAAYCVSALEHFGLGTYEDEPSPYLDVIAARYLYDALKPGGAAYVVVPWGGTYVEFAPHWRVYDHASFTDRVMQSFTFEGRYLFLSHPLIDRSGTITHPVGSKIDDAIVAGNRDGFPGISALIKMRKPLG